MLHCYSLKKKKSLVKDKVTLFWKQLHCFHTILIFFLFFFFLQNSLLTSKFQLFLQLLKTASLTRLFLKHLSAVSLSPFYSPFTCTDSCLVLHRCLWWLMRSNRCLWRQTSPHVAIELKPLLALQALCRGSIHHCVLNKKSLITDKTGRVASFFLFFS